MTERERFEEAYPHTPYQNGPELEVYKHIHYSHLKREWDGFQKGWQAAVRETRERCVQILEQMSEDQGWGSEAEVILIQGAERIRQDSEEEK